MKGLRIIPVFILLLALSYVGVLFVNANSGEIQIEFWGYKTPHLAIGLIVLTSIMGGMLIAGALCSIELLVLMTQNRKLRRKIAPRKPPSQNTLSERFAGHPEDEVTSETRLRTSADVEEKTGEIDLARNKNRFTPL